MTPAIGTAGNPFPGLRPFDEHDATFFYGRDEAVDEVLDRLAKNRVLALIGPSGSGKSSLIRAGVVPAIAGGALSRESSRWKIGIFRPGVDPVGNLAAALNRVEIEASAPALRASSQGLVDLVRRSDSGGGPLLIIVDQFEELFRFGRLERSEDRQFFAALLAAASRSDEAIYLLIAMRSDFIGEVSALPRLPEALSNSLFLMPRMTRLQIRQAIEEPIASAMGAIEPRCVQQLLNDVGDSPDSLVRLQHVLMRTWEAWQRRGAGGPVGSEDYQCAGTIARALDMHGEEVFGALESQEHKLARKLLQFLSGEESGQGVRRPTSFREIVQGLGESPERLANVIAQFTRGGFVVTSDVALHEQTVIDISHELLLRSWQRLGTWIAEERESRDTYLRLAYQARHSSSRLTGRDLEETLRWWDEWRPNASWAARYDSEFAQVRGFVEASRRGRVVRTTLYWCLPAGLTILLLAVIGSC